MFAELFGSSLSVDGFPPHSLVRSTDSRQASAVPAPPYSSQQTKLPAPALPLNQRIRPSALPTDNQAYCARNTQQSSMTIRALLTALTQFASALGSPLLSTQNSASRTLS